MKLTCKFIVTLLNISAAQMYRKLKNKNNLKEINMFLFIIRNFKKYDCKFLSQFYLCSDNLSLSIYISCFKNFLKIYARKSQSQYNILKSIVTSPKLYRYRLKQAILNMPNRTTSLRVVGDDIIPFLPFDPASVAASQSFAS